MRGIKALDAGAWIATLSADTSCSSSPYSERSARNKSKSSQDAWRRSHGQNTAHKHPAEW